MCSVGGMNFSAYSEIWRFPAVRQAVLLGVLGKAPWFGVMVVLTLHVVGDLGQGYASAGALSAVFTVAVALASPLRGRLLDTLGLRRTLAPSLILLPLTAVTCFFIGIGLVSKEVERRSVYSLLAKPIDRSQMILGKYAGLTLTLDDFKRILTQPLMVVVGTVAHFVIMPLVAVLLCWIFRLDGPLAVGVILVGCCPSGTSSNVMSYLSRGDVALDVSIGILSTLCAPFMIPLLMQWLASQYVTVPVESLFLNAVKVVLFPIALGVICHAIFKEKIEKVTVALPIVSQVAILLIIGVVVAANGSKLFVASSLLAIPVVILHNLCGYALGFGFSKLMYKVYPKGFRYAQQKAITFEVGMQDSALGATLALSSFASNPLAAVPSTFFSVWHNISGSVLSSWWREHDDKHQIHPDSDNGEKGSAAKASEAGDAVKDESEETVNA